MSASSGIGLSSELSSIFANAVSDSGKIRFIKVSIQNESLVHDLTVPIQGSLETDLASLQDILEENVPAYVLVKLDSPGEWLAIFYVPETANVRDKMLYASTRASLMKSLGSTSFVDSIFATTKADLTPEGYSAHRKHVTAPQPLSTREQEMADIRAAERSTETAYEGMQARASHVGTGVGLHWSETVESAIRQLASSETARLVLLAIEVSTETLVLTSDSECDVSHVGKQLPPSEPCYAILAWPHSHTSPPRKEIVFIYSCPTNSPIKHRMLYSSGSSSVFSGIKALLSSESCHISSRKIETSDPVEIDEQFLKTELGFINDTEVPSSLPEGMAEKKPFARPKGPGRKR